MGRAKRTTATRKSTRSKAPRQQQKKTTRKSTAAGGGKAATQQQQPATATGGGVQNNDASMQDYNSHDTINSATTMSTTQPPIMIFQPMEEPDENTTWFLERVCVHFKNNNGKVVAGVIQETTTACLGLLKVLVNQNNNSDEDDNSNTTTTTVVPVHVADLIMVRPKTQDKVILTRGENVGAEGILMVIDGIEGIIKDDSFTQDENYFIEDYVYCAKIIENDNYDDDDDIVDWLSQQQEQLAAMSMEMEMTNKKQQAVVKTLNLPCVTMEDNDSGDKEETQLVWGKSFKEVNITNIESLPVEVLKQIMQFADVVTLGSCVATNKTWNVLAKEDDLWAPHLKVMLHELFDKAVEPVDENSPVIVPLSQRPLQSTEFNKWWDDLIEKGQLNFRNLDGDYIAHWRTVTNVLGAFQEYAGEDMINREDMKRFAPLEPLVEEGQQYVWMKGKELFLWYQEIVPFREYYRRSGGLAFDGVQREQMRIRLCYTCFYFNGEPCRVCGKKMGEEGSCTDRRPDFDYSFFDTMPQIRLFRHRLDD